MKVRKKKRKQKEAEEELQQKVGMFEKLPDACDACKKTFDKKDKSMVQSWNVVVREAEGAVRLYCPECWNAARKAIEEVMKDG
tara:strand:- start:1063 stop:1311 length:249 start_codon:yes stop_codon:yes gene_type:complete